jgi:hypothetical protein
MSNYSCTRLNPEQSNSSILEALDLKSFGVKIATHIEDGKKSEHAESEIVPKHDQLETQNDKQPLHIRTQVDQEQPPKRTPAS